MWWKEESQKPSQEPELVKSFMVFKFTYKEGKWVKAGAWEILFFHICYTENIWQRCLWKQREVRGKSRTLWEKSLIFVNLKYCLQHICMGSWRPVAKEPTLSKTGIYIGTELSEKHGKMRETSMNQREIMCGPAGWRHVSHQKQLDTFLSTVRNCGRIHWCSLIHPTWKLHLEWSRLSEREALAANGRCHSVTRTSVVCPGILIIKTTIFSF